MQFRQQHQQPEVLQALDEGAVDVRVFFENRSGASVPFKSSNNNSRRREERGRVLVWSLLGVSAAADLVTPAAARLPDGAAAIRSAAAALEQQHQQQPLQQQLLLLQRCRAALPMRQGALWSFLLCAEVAAKLRNKVGEDVLPLAVQGVQAAPQLPLSWCTLGHSLRLRGRLWESRSCYRIAAHLAASSSQTMKSTAAAPSPPSAAKTPWALLGTGPRAALASAAAAAAAVPAKLLAALDETLLRARTDPKELRKALPTLMKAEVEAPWGFAVDANPPEVGGIFVAYVVENSKAEKAGLMPGDQIVVANNSILLGKPFESCLASLRARQRPTAIQLQQVLLPLQLEVYRGSFPVLYGAPALASLQRLGALKELLSGDNSTEQQYRQQQNSPLVYTAAGSLNAVLLGGDTRTSEFF
ncbi:Pdz domain protein, related, related [Eimeria maxima]|uniref:Pdz domain protein, related, related n=1 Tax=Eimeria maxima TaxID=5804 RepID=U6M938_EIMMA|nr:Pdz domain protein, related, related [Eimeria maxima]CDJ58185.1 Pdz domain protein, related, related [Eimeria maxima]